MNYRETIFGDDLLDNVKVRMFDVIDAKSIEMFIPRPS